jgi:ribonuclease HI
MLTVIHFDGGTAPTNPGVPYGSFQIEAPLMTDTFAGMTTHLHRWRCPFTLKSNNEAEYLTLWLALKEIEAKFRETTELKIFSDSALVVNQMQGAWKCRDPRMSRLRDKCRGVLSNILASAPVGRLSIGWVPRERIFSIFGH